MGWPVVKIAELCEVLDNKRKPITKKNRIEGPYPYYGATGVLDYVEGYLFDEDLVLIGEDGAKWGAGDNSAFSITGKTWVNNHAHVVKPHRDIILDQWLIYYLNGEDLSDFITGMTVPKLNQGKLKEISLPVPPIPEQKRIVALLDTVFADLEQTRTKTEQNLKNARELFDSYLQQVFSQKGEGWVEATLSSCFKLKRGNNLTSKKMVEGDYPVFGGNGIAGMHNDFNLEGHNVIVGRVGALCGNVRLIKEKIWLTDNAFKIVDFKVEFDSMFLTYLLNFKNLRSLARQAAQPVISNSSLKDLVLDFPICVKEQRLIALKLDSLSNKINELETIYTEKSKKLDELKKSILQKAFSGELTQG